MPPTRPVGFAAAFLACSVPLATVMPLCAQSPLGGSGGSVHMFNADMAIMEAREPRKDIPCEVTPIKPVLGFDLRFHAGYEVTIPLRELAGTENMLTMIFRVTPEEEAGEPSFFVQYTRVPQIDAEAKGEAYLQGYFDTGEGKYKVDWIMRDRREHYCSSYWDTEALLTDKDKQLTLVLPRGAVHAAEFQPFKEEPPVAREQGEAALNVKVLLNFAPQQQHSATLKPMDTQALASILRSVAREPRIGRFSVVAFNLQEQRILYRQDNTDRIDFPAIGEAIESLSLGTVDLNRLSQKNGETEFLTNLIKQELGGENKPDALIFAGPKAMLQENVPVSELKEVGDVEYPVFYMNFNLNPQNNPWRDSIGRAVRFFRGREFTISRPRDLWNAMTEIISRVITFKNGRAHANGAAQ